MLDAMLDFLLDHGVQDHAMKLDTSARSMASRMAHEMDKLYTRNSPGRWTRGPGSWASTRSRFAKATCTGSWSAICGWALESMRR